MRWELDWSAHLLVMCHVESMSSESRFIKYEEERDVVFVLGAGTSYAHGVPLQKDILPEILSSRGEEAQSEIGRSLAEFIDDYFMVKKGSNEYPTLEAIFGFLDYFIDRDECIGKELPTEKLRSLKEYLIAAIHHTISVKSNKQAGAYKQLWTTVADLNRNISVITTNYDTLLDEAFDFLYPDTGFIDYHVHFMNYDHYDSIDAFNWWIDPKVPVPIWRDGVDPKPIKILKVHGSLNWKDCRSCNQVLLTPWETGIDLVGGHFIHHQMPEGPLDEGSSSLYRCPFDGARFQTLIIPPSHNKSFSHPIINLLLEEAAREVRKAKKLVFIGYSFPDADVHLKALFHKNLAEDTKVMVITRSRSPEIERSYLSLSHSTEFIWKTFEEAVIDSDLMAKILESGTATVAEYDQG